jgi:hypothetical protein
MSGMGGKRTLARCDLDAANVTPVVWIRATSTQLGNYLSRNTIVSEHRFCIY